MVTDQLVELKPGTPLLLRRARKKPVIQTKEDIRFVPKATHMSVVTTAGNQPEMHDQQEDEQR